MNVKFRMPRFWNKHTGGGMLRELLLTTLATSISIILTFGTAAWIEKLQKEKNRRQTAMMVISDIYTYKRDLQGCLEQVFMKWKTDIEELQAMSRDSIMQLTDEEREKYWDALQVPILFGRDKTAENIFSSDISTWRDVGNFRFIRMVGHSYSCINEIDKNIKVKMDEKGDNVKIFETNHDWKNMSDGQRLVTFMEQKEVQRYIDDFSNGFIPYLNNSIDDLQHFINECMKIMDISEEELNKFMSDNK